MNKVCEPKIINRELFGEFNRYRLTEFRSRFGETIWFVDDAEQIDKQGLPKNIRQTATREDAVAGLL